MPLLPFIDPRQFQPPPMQGSGDPTWDDIANSLQNQQPNLPVVDDSIGPETPYTGGQGQIDPSLFADSMAQQRMNQLYQPEHTATDKLNQLLASMPVRNNPGLLSKIVGSMAGFGGGPRAADEVMYGPYYRQLEDWQNQVKPVEYAANLERQNNNLERQSAQTEINQQKANETERHHKETEATAKTRADAYAFKQSHPNAKITEDDEGNMIAIDPITHKVDYLTDDQGDPVKSTKLSDTDKLNLQFEHNMALVGARGKEARETKQTIPGKAAVDPKSMTPTQLKIAQYSKAEKAANSHPEWQKWIHLGTNGANTFTIDAPSQGMFGYGADDTTAYHNMIDYIYGKDSTESTSDVTTPIASDTPTKTSGNPNANPPKNAEGEKRYGPPSDTTGKVHVQNKYGASGWIPKEQLKDALGKGYKVIQ